MASFPAGAVWLASYPKSGNTWMRVLLANLMAGGAAPVDINALPDDYAVTSRRQFAEHMLIDADLLTPDELERLRPAFNAAVFQPLEGPAFCKTHDPFFGRDGAGRARVPVLGMAARAAVYLIRDPRDVAISFAHHMGADIDEAIRRMGDGSAVMGSAAQLSHHLGDWAGHVESWTRQDLVPVAVIRYEDLRRDTHGCFAAMLKRLGVAATAAEIDRAVAHSSLKALQGQERLAGFRERLPGQDRFFRSGRVEGWRDVLSTAQIRAIEDQCAATMIRWGYALAG
ncbi:sulfotransferase domain-containing protein [Tistrella mobilis]|uniref:sulfotransferase domain-containing protein n=1 Tax=Tistrella mobilis TaxID=171437 RepID=UPI0035581536